MKHISLKIIVSFGLLLCFSCKPITSIVQGTPITNSKASQEKPYVILISLDGFRWDYVERFQPPNMVNFIKNGVQAESLIPAFPSKTFPNHYTIATGMYPENHGIIGNSFYSYKKNKLYRLGNRETVEDGTFYKGTPIWVAAEKENMVSASFFFVGTEADIQGIHPSYYYTFDNSIKNEVRVQQALDWLALPVKKRPHLITMYFSDMDNTGHDFGPSNDEKLKETLFALDKHLGDLFRGVTKSGLPINIIIVSDHGMADIPVSKYLPIENIENNELYTTLNNGAIVNIHPKKNVTIDSVYTYLKRKEQNFKIYKTEETPGFEYTPKNKDWGTIQVLPNHGYYFSSNRGIEIRKQQKHTTFGVHGYDPKQKDMHGIFYANGPAFKNGFLVPSVKNIHIYPVMSKILGLEIPNDIDGDLNEINSVLNTPD
ncbi:ectonucleotide pyrophosphatase/phosphodiesterase [uncultured Croceitalea sp.]|uniref:alkaline phosphatase family protein n=1 Tax=uncultured Croceitalea sp. TaxID=1798908 RepID=UPI0033068B42